MKKLLLLFQASLFIAYGLSVGIAKSNHTASISGIIKNAKYNHVKIGDRLAKVDGKGYFELSLDLREADYFTLWHGKEILLFLTPGDHITLTLDADDFFNTMKFSGKGADVNNFLADLAILNEKHIRPLDFEELFSLDEDSFLAKIESLEATYQQALDSFFNSHETINQKFAKFEQARIRYSWANIRLQYPKRHQAAVKQKAVTLSEDYNSYLSQLDFNALELWQLREYRNFLNNYLNIKAEETLETETSLQSMDNQLTNATYRIAMETFTNPTFKNYFLYSIMKKQIEDYGIKNIDDLMKNFKKDCTNKKYRSEINELYKKDAALAKNHTIKVYKTVNNITLDTHIYAPADLNLGDKRPSIVFFHGGGWSYGKPLWCMDLCSHFPAQGLVVISAEYRLVHRHGTTPLESIADAKSIIRWIRQNAQELGIDPDRIVASGMSSGGHLAASTGILQGFDEPGEDLNISSVPNALILFSAVVNTTLNPWMQSILGDRVLPKDISPVHHIRPGIPPTIIFHGKADRSAPLWTVEMFNRKMKQAGNRCEFHSYGGGHFFLNDDDIYKEVLTLAEKFLASLGYLKLK